MSEGQIDVRDLRVLKSHSKFSGWKRSGFVKYLERRRRLGRFCFYHSPGHSTRQVGLGYGEVGEAEGTPRELRSKSGADK